MRFIFFILFALCSYGTCEAVNYYFSSKGNNAQDGKTKATPWHSLQNITEIIHLLKSGDSILLERGSFFNTSLSLSNSYIYVGTYGVGSKPVISGAVEVTNWTYFGKNIWTTRCANCIAEPGNLLMNEKIQPLGRYPNEGYLTLSGSSKQGTLISDITLPFADNYWNHAELVVRSSRWTLDNLPVTDYHNKTFHASARSSYSLQNGFGYFIQKHISTLDQHGEWFFDSTTKQIFLYLRPAIKPHSLKIEVSIQAVGLNVIHAQNITIENLTFTGQRITGVSLKDCNNIALKNITILNSAKNGLEVISCTYPYVANSLIADSNNNGVEWHNNNAGSFINNTIVRTGLKPGLGGSGNGTHIALNITSDSLFNGNNLFQYNTIDSTGYSGIDFRTGHTQIKNNFITNFCMTKDDGAGIYTWSNTKGDNTIEGNIILRGIGAGDGTLNSNQRFASGIYIDDRSSRVLIKDNTISQCATSGVFLHNAKTITLTGNLLVDNGNTLSNEEKGQLYIKLDTLGSMAGKINLDLKILQNKFISLSDISYCIYLSATKKRDLHQLGIFEQNQYRASYTVQAVGRSYQHESCSTPEELTLANWQRMTRYESGSTFIPLPLRHCPITGKNMITNSSMTNMEGWFIWRENSTLIQERKKIIDGPSLKANIPSCETEALLYHAGFVLSKGKLYRLRFTARSDQATKIEFAPLMANSPWQSLGDNHCFAIDSSYKTFTYFFKPVKNCFEARVNFKSHKTFWIDNVSLYEIDERPNSKGEEIRLIYNNTKNSKTISLSGKLVDPDKPKNDTITLLAYQSRFLYLKR